MESLQQLSNESFSYSWLINIKPSVDDEGFRHSFDTQDGNSFIEMDPDFISMRWTSEAHDFDFGIPSSQAPVLVHADQIFSKGLILPLHLITSPKSNELVSDSSDSVLRRSLSVDSSKTLLSQSNRYCSQYLSDSSIPIFDSEQTRPMSVSSCSWQSTPSRITKLKLPFFRNCVKSPKKIFRKYLCFLTPIYKKVMELSSTSTKTVRRGADPVRTSPRANNAFSSIEWCCNNTMFDIGDEKKIYDAVLHCKKSIRG